MPGLYQMEVLPSTDLLIKRRGVLVFRSKCLQNSSISFDEKSCDTRKYMKVVFCQTLKNFYVKEKGRKVSIR